MLSTRQDPASGAQPAVTHTLQAAGDRAVGRSVGHRTTQHNMENYTHYAQPPQNPPRQARAAAPVGKGLGEKAGPLVRDEVAG